MTWKAQIIAALRRYGPLSIAELCRVLNGLHPRDLHRCVWCSYYLNPRRRKFHYNHKPSCRPNYRQVARAVRQLEKAGVIVRRREIRSDPRNERGWDYFTVCYLAAEQVKQ